jgi:hypothetical protein
MSLISKPPTFKVAQSNLLESLTLRGWDVRTTASTGKILKTPYAIHPGKKYRLWFKTQAVYFSVGETGTLNEARSIHLDIRTCTVDDLIKQAEYFVNP